MGPITEPCGTPKKTSAGLELKPPKNSATNAIERLKPVEVNIVVDSIKSRKRPRRVKTDTSPLTRASRQSLVILSSAVSVL